MLYELLLFLSLLVYVPKAFLRKRLPHPGWTMRLGRYPEAVRASLQQPGAVWIHAVSVGEAQAVRPLIRELTARWPQTPLVLSTITPTGYDVASRLLGERGVTIYAPFDFRATVKRAMAAIKPRMLLLVESELWPNLILLAKQQGVPIAVINGRISARAFRRYLWIKPWLGRMLRAVDLFLMQTDVDAERIIRMGAPPSKVKVLGSLKWDASLISRPAPEELKAIAARLGLTEDDALIVAGSTHRGEELAILDALQEIRVQLPRVKLVIAPRHLERLGEIEELVRARALQAQRVTGLAAEAGRWDVLLIDTMGQLPVYYGLANVAFVGGSLIPHGGQNPLEPASLGKPVLFGPSMENFAEIAHQLLIHQAARQLGRREELAAFLSEWLANPAEARVAGAYGQALVERLSGVSRRTLETLTGLLTAPSPTA